MSWDHHDTHGQKTRIAMAKKAVLELHIILKDRRIRKYLKIKLVKAIDYIRDGRLAFEEKRNVALLTNGVDKLE